MHFKVAVSYLLLFHINTHNAFLPGDTSRAKRGNQTHRPPWLFVKKVSIIKSSVIKAWASDWQRRALLDHELSAYVTARPPQLHSSGAKMAAARASHLPIHVHLFSLWLKPFTTAAANMSSHSFRSTFLSVKLCLKTLDWINAQIREFCVRLTFDCHFIWHSGPMFPLCLRLWYYVSIPIYFEVYYVCPQIENFLFQGCPADTSPSSGQRKQEEFYSPSWHHSTYTSNEQLRSRGCPLHNSFHSQHDHK